MSGVEALSPGLPEIKEKSGIWNLVPVGEMLPWWTCDSKVLKEPFKDQSFAGGDNAGMNTGRTHASGAQHTKEKEGRGGGAHREWCSVGERGDEGRLWVSAWCLGEGYKECELN